MNDPFTEPKRPWHRQIKSDRPTKAGRYDTRFYKRKAWERIRQNQLWNNPYCEISEAYGRLEDGEHVDHIVPRSKGGSDTDPRNLMTLSRDVHGMKSGLERVRGCLVATRETASGLIPARREEIIEYIGNMIFGGDPTYDL